MRKQTYCAASLAVIVLGGVAGTAGAATFTVVAPAADARVRDIGPAYDGLGNNASETTNTTRRNGHFGGGNEDTSSSTRSNSRRSPSARRSTPPRSRSTTI
jgi:hypothetical protein